MKKNNLNQLQLYLLTFYLTISILFIYFIFSYVDFNFVKLSDEEFLYESFKTLENYFLKNYFIFTIIFLFTGFFYLFFLGFPLPLIIVSSLIYGPKIGSVLGIIFLTLSSFCIFISYDKFFFKDIFIKKAKLLDNKYLNFIQKNQFKSIILFRLLGSSGIPFALQNLILCNLNISKKTFFWGTFFGMLPGTILTNLIIHQIFEFIY